MWRLGKTVEVVESNRMARERGKGLRWVWAAKDLQNNELLVE